MALNWQWKNKCGEVTASHKIDGIEREFQVNLYQGNAYLIMVYEYKENGTDMYSLYGFFNDKEHMRRMFGIDKKSKDSHNCFTEWKKVRINKKMFSHTKEFVTALAEAFGNIDIEIYSE